MSSWGEGFLISSLNPDCHSLGTVLVCWGVYIWTQGTHSGDTFCLPDDFCPAFSMLCSTGGNLGCACYNLLLWHLLENCTWAFYTALLNRNLLIMMMIIIRAAYHLSPDPRKGRKLERQKGL